MSMNLRLERHRLRRHGQEAGRHQHQGALSRQRLHPLHHSRNERQRNACVLVSQLQNVSRRALDRAPSDVLRQPLGIRAIEIVCDGHIQRRAVVLVDDPVGFHVTDVRTLRLRLAIHGRHVKLRHRFLQLRVVLQQPAVAARHRHHCHRFKLPDRRGQQLRANSLRAHQVAFVQVHVVEHQHGTSRLPRLRRASRRYRRRPERPLPRPLLCPNPAPQQSASRALAARSRLHRESRNRPAILPRSNISKIFPLQIPDSAPTRIPHDHRNQHCFHANGDLVTAVLPSSAIRR